MVDNKIREIIRSFLAAAEATGIHVERALLFGSHATGKAGPESDIDVAIVAGEFDTKERRRWMRRLWELRSKTDNSIEPFAIGSRQWQIEQGSPLIEVVRREGIAISKRAHIGSI